MSTIVTLGGQVWRYSLIRIAQGTLPSDRPVQMTLSLRKMTLSLSNGAALWAGPWSSSFRANGGESYKPEGLRMDIGRMIWEVSLSWFLCPARLPVYGRGFIARSSAHPRPSAPRSGLGRCGGGRPSLIDPSGSCGAARLRRSIRARRSGASTAMIPWDVRCSLFG